MSYQDICRGLNKKASNEQLKKLASLIGMRKKGAWKDYIPDWQGFKDAFGHVYNPDNPYYQSRSPFAAYQRAATDVVDALPFPLRGSPKDIGDQLIALGGKKRKGLTRGDSPFAKLRRGLASRYVLEGLKTRSPLAGINLESYWNAPTSTQANKQIANKQLKPE